MKPRKIELIIITLLACIYMVACEKEKNEPDKEQSGHNVEFLLTARGETYSQIKYTTAHDTVGPIHGNKGNYSHKFTQHSGYVEFQAKPENAPRPMEIERIDVYLIIGGDTVARDSSQWNGDDAIVSKSL